MNTVHLESAKCKQCIVLSVDGALPLTNHCVAHHINAAYNLLKSSGYQVKFFFTIYSAVSTQYQHVTDGRPDRWIWIAILHTALAVLCRLLSTLKIVIICQCYPIYNIYSICIAKHTEKMQLQKMSKSRLQPLFKLLIILVFFDKSCITATQRHSRRKHLVILSLFCD